MGAGPRICGQCQVEDAPSPDAKAQTSRPQCSCQADCPGRVIENHGDKWQKVPGKQGHRNQRDLLGLLCMTDTP